MVKQDGNEQGINDKYALFKATYVSEIACTDHAGLIFCTAHLECDTIQMIMGLTLIILSRTHYINLTRAKNARLSLHTFHETSSN